MSSISVSPFVVVPASAFAGAGAFPLEHLCHTDNDTLLIVAPTGMLLVSTKKNKANCAAIAPKVHAMYLPLPCTCRHVARSADPCGTGVPIGDEPPVAITPEFAMGRQVAIATYDTPTSFWIPSSTSVGRLADVGLRKVFGSCHARFPFVGSPENGTTAKA